MIKEIFCTFELFVSQSVFGVIGLNILDFHLLDLIQIKPAVSDSVSLLSGPLRTMP